MLNVGFEEKEQGCVNEIERISRENKTEWPLLY